MECQQKIVKMKKILMGFAAAIAMLFLANCATKTKSTENVKRQWMLIEFQNFSKDLMVKNKANLDFTNWTTENPKFSAKMGCNGMFGTASFKENQRVEFSQVGSTMMYCDKNMDLESAFGKALPMMKNYSINGHFLTLSDSEGNKMKFVAADWD